MVAMYEMGEAIEKLVYLVGVMEKLERKLEKKNLSERRRWGAEKELYLLRQRLVGSDGKERR